MSAGYCGEYYVEEGEANVLVHCGLDNDDEYKLDEGDNTRHSEEDEVHNWGNAQRKDIYDDRAGNGTLRVPGSLGNSLSGRV